MNFKKRTVPFKVKAVENNGDFAGYLSVFGNVDAYRDVVMPGAFAKSLAQWKSDDALPPILWQHNSDQPLGPFTTMSEDGTGLYVEGTLLVKQIQQAQEAHALLKAKVIRGMSIGYDVADDGMTYQADTNVWQLTGIDLWEGSICTFPANPDAIVSEVKGLLGRGDMPTVRQFEDFLRESGFSKSRATAIASHGLASLLRREAESDKSSENGEIPESLTSATAAIDKFSKFSYPL